MSAATQTLDREAMDALVDRARREIDSGLLPSCQLAIAQHGEVVLDVTLGDATPDTRYVIFSCTKALVASAIWLLIGDDRLDPSVRVAEIIPEFGANGKDVVTVEQLLVHTSGFPRAPLGPPDWYTREARLARFERWRLTFAPGTKFEYHPTSAHWVLAEVIERLSGTDYREFIRGASSSRSGSRGSRSAFPKISSPTSRRSRVAVRPRRPTSSRRRSACASCRSPRSPKRCSSASTNPANLALGSARRRCGVDGRRLRALLPGPARRSRRGVGARRAPRRHQRDPQPFPRRARCAREPHARSRRRRRRRAERGRGFGHTVSPAAFGHNGAGGQIAWADPATGLSFVYLTNGLDRNVLREWRRTSGIASRAARCAG